MVADFICGTSFFLFVFYILKLNSNVKSILMTNLFLKPAYLLHRLKFAAAPKKSVLVH